MANIADFQAVDSKFFAEDFIFKILSVLVKPASQQGGLEHTFR